MNKAVKITDRIFWTGVYDRDIRVFDIVMHTEYGTTYNSYVIKGNEKTALIEVSKERFFDEFIERLSDVADPREIDYIILNHTEPDHTGSLAKLLELNPDVEIVGSAASVKFIKDIVNRDIKSRIVKDGDMLDLGGKTLQFMIAPFLHWPDTMLTYCAEDRVLFACDFLGCHYCPGSGEGIFNDEIKIDFMEAYKYYFDVIMSPFKSYVLQADDKIKDLPLDAVCVGHGPVLRTDIQKYIGLYRQWAEVTKPENPSVMIAYVSNYGYTAKLAGAIAEGIKAAGAEAYIYNIIESNLSEILEKISAASGILIGSPTLVGDTLPPVWELLSQLNPTIHKGKIAGAFGSYGWSGEAVPNIMDRFKQLRLKTPLEPLRVVFNPTEDDLTKAVEFGKRFAEEAGAP